VSLSLTVVPILDLRTTLRFIDELNAQAALTLKEKLPVPIQWAKEPTWTVTQFQFLDYLTIRFIASLATDVKNIMKVKLSL
jgi:hypothetical protein